MPLGTPSNKPTDAAQAIQSNSGFRLIKDNKIYRAAVEQLSPEMATSLKTVRPVGSLDTLDEAFVPVKAIVLVMHHDPHYQGGQFQVNTPVRTAGALPSSARAIISIDGNKVLGVFEIVRVLGKPKEQMIDDIPEEDLLNLLAEITSKGLTYEEIDAVNGKSYEAVDQQLDVAKELEAEAEKIRSRAIEERAKIDQRILSARARLVGVGFELDLAAYLKKQSK